MFTCTVEGDFRDRVQRTQRRINLQLTTSVAQAAKAGVAAAKQGSFKDRSGRLRAEIHHDAVVKSGSEIFTHMVSATPYALYIEEGTRPHEIWPKEGGGFIGPLRPGQGRRDSGDIGTRRIALRWYVGGTPVFARMVHHPGTRAYRYMHNGARVAEYALRESLQDGFVNLQAIWN